LGDTIVSEASEEQQDSSAADNVPVGAGIATGAALAGIVVDPSNIGDVSVRKECISGNKRELKRESKNSQLYAVQYNIIRRRKRDVICGFEPVTCV
jgi:hypothetical protein